MKDHLGAPPVEHLLEPGGIADITEFQGEPLIGEFGSQTAFGGPEAVFSAPQQHDPCRAKGCHLPGQFATDGAATACDQDDGILKDQAEGSLVQMHRFAA